MFTRSWACRCSRGRHDGLLPRRRERARTSATSTTSWTPTAPSRCASTTPIERRYQGIPWVNSIAADSNGEAYYTMNGAIPNMPDARVAGLPDRAGRGRPSTTLGLPTVDGSRSSCNWEQGTAPGPPTRACCQQPKIPTLFRRDYVHNGNDSHWLTNASHPLEGYDRIVGIERAERTPRTRLGLIMVARPPGRPRRAARQPLHAAEPEADRAGRPPVPGRAVARPDRAHLPRQPHIDGVDVSGACDVLARWNRRDDLDAPGALLFRRFAARASRRRVSLPTGTEGSTDDRPAGLRQPLRPRPPGGHPERPGRHTRPCALRWPARCSDLRGAGPPTGRDAARPCRLDKPTGHRRCPAAPATWACST